jgi:hypothetical protein
MLSTSASTSNRLLKKAPNFVLGSSKSSTYPRGYASGFDSPAASLDGLFEQPAQSDVYLIRSRKVWWSDACPAKSPFEPWHILVAGKATRLSVRG